MDTKIITTSDTAGFSLVERLLTEAFPEDERRPLDAFRRLADHDGRFSVILLSDGAVTAGFITVWDFDGFRYVEHFAIISAMRGGGLGGEAIRNFVAADPMPVILEVEPSGSNDMADRRIAFYERCGFTGHRDFEYIQPPYSPGLPEVPLMLMTSDKGVDLGTTAGEIRRRVYGVSDAEPQAADRLPEDR